MLSAATHLHPADPADQQAEDAQYYRRVLHAFIDMGTDLARTVHQQATCPADPADPDDDRATTPVHDAVAAFGCISRAVRRTIALARKVAEPLPPRAAGSDRAAARRRILREVEDVIQRTVDGADAEALHAELSERMDAPDLDDEIDDRPVAEIIVDICRDLGIAVTFGTHPWKRRTPREIEALCVRAAQPRTVSSPVVAPVAPGGTGTGGDPPSTPRDAGADLLRFTFPVRGT